MRNFSLLRVSLLMSRITYALDLCREKKHLGLTEIEDMSRFVDIANDTVELAETLGFVDSEYKARTLKMRLELVPNVADFSGMHMEMIHLQQGLMLDMGKFKFFQMERPEFFEDDRFFGPEIILNFPSAKQDMLGAANCLCVDLNTAAVFHLMRVVEWGLRALCCHLGLTEVVVDKKNAKAIPVEFAVWDRILNQLPAKAEERINIISDREQRHHAQTLYYPLIEEVNGFKEAWRNHVMHSRAHYTYEDAVAIHSHVKRFMNRLAVNGIVE
jgi:hypothetical protein